MAPYNNDDSLANDLNVLPELLETIADVDHFFSQQGQALQAVLDDTIENVTTCSPMTCSPTYDCYATHDAPSMTVLGIFTREKKPRQDELPEDPGLSVMAKDQLMCRRRLDTETEEAMFVPEKGIVGAEFWHVTVLEEGESDDEESDSDDEDDEEDWEPRIYEERAVLFQAMEHYERLRNEPSLAKYFEAEDETAFQDDLLKNPRFGEQIIVQGMQASDVSIGDIFEVEEGLSPLKLEISSPRLCCAYVDKRNGSAYGLAGVKRYCNTYGLGGFFARVLVAGQLNDGMKLVRTQHPHPKWTMEYVSMTLYGEGPRKFQLKNHAYWSRDIKELKELCELEAFARYEWRDEAKYVLKHWNKYHPEDKQQNTSLTLWTRNSFAFPLFMSGLSFNSFFGSAILQSLQQSYKTTIEHLDILTEYLVDHV